MTAVGVVAVCAAGGVIAGPFLDAAARRIRRSPSASVSNSTSTTSIATDGVEAADAAMSTMAAAPAAVPPAWVGSPATAAPAAVPPATAASATPAWAPVAAPLPTTHGAVRAEAVRAEAVAAAVVTGALFALAAVRIGAHPQLSAYCSLFAGLVAVSIADLRTGLVPRKLLYPSAGLVAAGLVAASAEIGDWHPMLDALIGGAAAFVFFAAIWWVYPRGLGFGDVRLAGLCGLALGWLGFRQLYLGFLAGFVLGAAMGFVVLAVRRSRRFPFAPALATGAVFGVLWGGWLGNLWLHPG